MSRFRTSLIAAGLALAAAVAPAAPAFAHKAPKPTYVELIGIVRQLDGTSAEVHARYRCTGELGVWISVKQSEDRTADPKLTQEGTGYGKVAAAWSQTHAHALDCDGRVHVDKFVVDRAEYGYGEFKRGQAWTQFCIVNGTGVVASDMEFKKML
ncbi:hypothetical protein [Desertivibrio insolitus]|uniref:hypothetical protein n=1 Tax=Herbiconiux sp. SYSU D00978 TaxID=2812562 RepID=UPI001A966D38|nr:hypothetical protein [Herbiconiux sp. SYSU D00978]